MNPTSIIPIHALPIISVIAAVSRNGVLGKDNKLLWHIPEDLRYFKEKTLGKSILMGRKTYESLPRRPLPNRHNIVLTRNPAWRSDAADVSIINDEAIEGILAEAFAAAELHHGGKNNELFIIGGASLYAQILRPKPLADYLYLTEIDADFEGDAFFPKWDRTAYREVSRERHRHLGETASFAYDFVVYQRIK